VTLVDQFTQTMFVQDGTGAVWVALPVAMRSPTIGFKITLRGNALAVGPDRAVVNPVIESLQDGVQPEPRQITRGALTAERKDYVRSRFRARIKRIIPTIGKEIRFSGEMAGGMVEVSLQTAQALDVEEFVGQEVDVTGVPAPPTQASTTSEPLFLAQRLQPLAAVRDATPLPRLTTVRDVKALDPVGARRAYPVDLHGVITTSSPPAHMVTMQDATGAVFIWLLHAEHFPPEGCRVRIEGTSAASESVPMVAASKVTVEGPAPLPTPIELSRFRINDVRFDNLWVHIDGVVRRVSPSPIGAFQLVVSTEQYRTVVVAHTGTATEAARFVPGTPVSLEGAYSAHADRFRRWRYFMVYTPSLSGIRIRGPAPARGSGPPVLDMPLRTLFRYGSASSPTIPVRVRGIVTLDGADGSFYISDGDGGVQVAAAAGSGTVKPGTRVEVTGFLPTDPTSLRIEDATWSTASTMPLPEAPIVPAESALDGSYESRWVRMAGRLTHRQEAVEHNILVLQSTSALVNVYSAGEPDTGWNALRPDSVLLVRGVVLPPMDRTTLAGSRTVSILIGSSRDIQVLSMASWWTPAHLTATLIVASALLFALLLIAAVLGRRVWTQARTIERRLEEEAALKVEAQSASRAKSQFLATMSHEIRTPMNGVLGLTELAVRTVGQPEQASYLENALLSARSLMRILNDILDLAKIEAGKMAVVDEDFSLAAILQSVCAAAAVQCRAKGIEFRCNMQPGVPDALLGDGKRVQQIVSNLVSNACKFTHEGKVEVEVSAENRLDGRFTLVVHVRDTGIGIPADQIARVFGDFEQADRTDKRHYDGTGLGLAICLRLAHLMGGQITAASEVGAGSDFHLRLPMRILQAVTAEEAAASLPAAGAEPLAPRPLRILAAEDNRINQLLLGKILEMEGHAAVFAGDGAETLRLWQCDHFDLLLVDLQMPVMDGLQVAEEIRRHEAGTGRRTPIVAVTARAMYEDRDRALAAGMDDFVSKPYSVEDLRSAIGRVAGKTNGKSSH